MYSAMTIEGVATQARADAKRARDVVANTSGLRMIGGREQDDFRLISSQPDHPLAARPNGVAHDQLATRLGIPTRYYRRMLETTPQLAMQNVNTWFETEPKNFMVRTFQEGDGSAIARAILSDCYLRLDNSDVLNAFFEGLEGSGRSSRVHVLGGAITDKRMHLNLLFKDLPVDIDGDEHYIGVCLKNSEVGYGAAAVYAFLYRSYCDNGMVFGQKDLVGFDRRHVGQRRGHGQLSPETHKQIARVLISSCNDVAQQISQPDQIERLVEPLRRAKRSATVEHPLPAFEELARSIDLKQSERDSAIERFISEGDYSRFGAANAVTWLANDPDRGAERTHELTEVGADVINLTERQWSRIATAE